MRAKLSGGRWRREMSRFARFGIVGLSGFIVDFVVLNVLMWRFGFSPALANTCSFTLAVSNTFFWNRMWTFPESRQRPIATQITQFFVVNLVGLAINQATFLGSNALVWRHLFGAIWAYNFAKMTASGVALFWNFGANRLWTWRGLVK